MPLPPTKHSTPVLKCRLVNLWFGKKRGILRIRRSTTIHAMGTVLSNCILKRVSSWNVMVRGNWRMVWVASTLHTTSEHGVSSITTADAHNSAASSRLNWRPRRFKWTRPFRRKKKSDFCACTITFQTHYTSISTPLYLKYLKKLFLLLLSI